MSRARRMAVIQNDQKEQNFNKFSVLAIFIIYKIFLAKMPFENILIFLGFIHLDLKTKIK